jgi:uncharacterized membrane protein
VTPKGQHVRQASRLRSSATLGAHLSLATGSAVDPRPIVETAPAAAPDAAAEKTAKLVYVLYLVSLAVGVTAIVGLVMAYLNVGEAPEALKTHYRVQIRTFWIGLLYGVVGALSSFILIGFAVLAFTAVWLIIRCVKGLKHLERREAYPNPATWLW